MRKAVPIDQFRLVTVPFEVKAVSGKADDGSAGSFKGYAGGIWNIDKVGDLIWGGAFDDDLDYFLKNGFVAWQHNWEWPIGKPVEAREDGYGLYTDNRVSATTQGKDAIVLLRDGVVKKMSIGYRVNRNKKDGSPGYRWADRAGLLNELQAAPIAEERKAAIVKQFDEEDWGEIFIIKSLRLYEVSAVSVPANDNAIILDAKGLLAGLSFRDQLLTALAAAKEVKTHAENITALRAKEGRMLGAERRAGLEELASELTGVSDAIRAVLTSEPAKTEPEGHKEPAPAIQVSSVFAEFQRIEARHLGCAV